MSSMLLLICELRLRKVDEPGGKSNHFAAARYAVPWQYKTRSLMTTKCQWIRIMIGLTLMLCSSATRTAADQDGLRDTSSPPPPSPVISGLRATHCGTPPDGRQPAPHGACIIDLKPGDVRLFAPSPPGLEKLHRWFELSTAALGIQYLFVRNGLGVIAAHQQQYQVAVTGRFKLDAKGRLSVHAGLFTGSSFAAGSNNTGLGLGAAQSSLYLKHLYVSVLPLDGVEIQYGGLNIWHDESTDITGYTYNGYIVGERVSIKRPKELFFDDISIGYGYVGDLHTPNVIRRADRLARSNFHRLILRKDLGERAWLSADYAFQAGVPTWREAIRLRTAELRAVDTFHAEIYQIQRIRSGYGFATYVEKTVHPKFVIGGGYADIHGLVLNSDRYAPGKRVFVNAKIPLNEAFSILVFWTQATAPAAANLPQQRLDVELYYNVLDFLRKRHLY